MTYPIDEEMADYIFRMVGKLNQFDAVIISDYGKGVITPYVFYGIMEQADLFNIFVAVDPNGTDYSKYTGANIITPNLKEARAASAETTTIEAAQVIMLEAELPQLLITLGGDGMALFGDGDYYHIDTEAKEVFDVSGAGDTVIAAFTLAVAAGYTMKQAAYISNVAAGIVVSKAGTATVSLSELEEELEQKVVY
jgi:D-beta-D-heptose 7-phosphate kinase/D-beta-D-heptose 1-phosphate adenosyltransferase